MDVIVYVFPNVVSRWDQDITTKPVTLTYYTAERLAFLLMIGKFCPTKINFPKVSQRKQNNLKLWMFCCVSISARRTDLYATEIY